MRKRLNLQQLRIVASSSKALHCFLQRPQNGFEYSSERQEISGVFAQQLWCCIDLQTKVKSLGSGQDGGQHQRGVEAYLAAPTATKKQKLSNGAVGNSGEKKKKWARKR